MSPEELFTKLIFHLQKLGEFTDQFLDKFPTWKDSRSGVISDLSKLADDLDAAVRKWADVKERAAGAAIFGGALMAVGAVLLPFSGGVSGLMIGAGAATAAGGGISVGVAELAKYGITKDRCKEMDSVVERDSDSTKSIANIMKKIELESRQIKMLLDTELDGEDNEKMRTLYGLALGLGPTSWLSKVLLSILEKKRKPHPSHHLRERPKVETTVEDEDRKEGEVVGSEEEETDGVTKEGSVEDVQVNDDTVSGEDDTDGVGVAQIELVTQVDFGTELEEGCLLAAEEIGGEVASMEIIELAATASAAAPYLVPAFAIIGVGFFELMSGIEEKKHGSKVAWKIREANDQLRAKTGNANNIFQKMKQLEWVKVKQQEKKKKKRRHRLEALVPVSTFNIKGTVQSNAYKKFLQTVFQNLPCQLHHLQECIWRGTSNVWLGLHVQQILPLGFVVSSTPTKDAAIACDLKNLTLVEKLNFPNNSSVRNRICACKMSAIFTRELIWSDDYFEVTVRKNALEFLSFSFHGYYKISNQQKVRDITSFIQYVVWWCEQKRLPAIVGGDFNYNIKDIAWSPQLQQKIKIFGGTNLDYSSIDYLCVVCGNMFPTKMAMMGPFFRYLDIRPFIPNELLGRITNHVPYFGEIMLFRDLPDIQD